MSRYVTAQAVRSLSLRLSDRDWQVVEHVSTLRFVSGHQLTRLCFTSSDDAPANARAARRALLRLVRLGILDRLPRAIGGVRAGSAGYVYRLGLAGQRVAEARGWQPQRPKRRSQVPGLLFVRHTLAIAELHTRLIECERSGRLELLALEAEPSCHRLYDGLGLQRRSLKPDSYVRLGIGPYEDSYFIEVDRATLGSRALESQLQRYIAYYRSGQEQAERGVFPKVLWLAESPERVGVIADCIRALPTTHRELFAVALLDQATTLMLEKS